MTTLLLVTGSRALADRPESEVWARARIEEAIAAMPGCEVLTGDATGPDVWAVEAAGLAVVLTRMGAVIAYRNGEHLEYRPQWVEGNAPRDREAWHDRLLARDRALVARAAARAASGDTVRVLALVAPWSKTHGTEYTARRARKAGLDVTTLTYPEMPQ